MFTDCGHVEFNLKQLQNSIHRSMLLAGRSDDILVLAVSKYLQIEEMLELRAAGLTNFAENRVKPALEKVEYFKLNHKSCAPDSWHFIGHIQSNKVRQIVGKFTLLHSIDSLKLARAIDKECSRIGVIQEILLQVNVSEEEQKSGFTQAELLEVFPELLTLKSIKMSGLMGMAAIGTKEQTSGSFRDLANLRKTLSNKFELQDFKHLSMGMSEDYEIAIEEGATILRIGSVLFK
jgi:PLP dependent protein